MQYYIWYDTRYNVFNVCGYSGSRIGRDAHSGHCYVNGEQILYFAKINAPGAEMQNEPYR